MARRIARLIGALALCLWVWSPSAAQADRRGHEPAAKQFNTDRQQEYSHRKYRHARKYGHGTRNYGQSYRGRHSRRHGVRKYVYGDNYCRTSYKYGKHGFKYVSRCRDRGFHGRRSLRFERHGSNYGRGGVIVIQPYYIARTLESAADGQAIVWNDPRARTRYEVVPTQTYREDNGRYCREYQSTASVGGKTREVYGKACRQEDGSWELVR